MTKTYITEFDEAALAAAGYECEFIPADWHDNGGPENGPQIVGHPDLRVWSKKCDDRKQHDVVVDARDGEVLAIEYEPIWHDFPF